MRQYLPQIDCICNVRETIELTEGFDLVVLAGTVPRLPPPRK